MMTTHSFQNLRRLLQEPLYCYHQEPVGLVVDKLTDGDENRFKRTRYIITAGKQCTCRGYTKASICKHIKMWNNDFSFKTPLGCGREHVLSFITNAIEVCRPALPKSVAGWEKLIEGYDTTLGELITVIGLPIYASELKKGGDLWVGWHKWEDGSSVAVKMAPVPDPA